MMEACKLTDRGCVRPNNEDYCLIDPEAGWFILADGMGGAKAGEYASRLAVETVAEALRSADRRDPESLLHAFEYAHRRVLETASGDRKLEGMGTTLVAAVVSGDGLAIASVGDSRFYEMDSDGLRQITADQSWVNEVGRQLGLDEQTLRSHPMRHVLTMAIGARAPLAVNSYSRLLSKGCIGLMCTDGLHGVLDDSEIAGILTGAVEGGALADCCAALVSAAKKAGGPDNITVIVIRRV